MFNYKLKQYLLVLHPTQNNGFANNKNFNTTFTLSKKLCFQKNFENNYLIVYLSINTFTTQVIIKNAVIFLVFISTEIIIPI